MVEFNGGFNADEHESMEFETLPEGVYNVTPVESAKKEIKSGKGHVLSVKFQVIDGTYKNRTIWCNYNLWHQDEQTAKFAAADFANLLRAVEVQRISDSREIHNKPLTVKVGHRKYDGKLYADIKGYYQFGNAEKVGTKPTKEAKEKAPWEK